MNYKKILFILSLASYFNYSCSKVLIITHAYNRPEFIPLQDITFKKFLKDDYEFVVFNDARDPKIKKDIYKRFAKTICYKDDCFILDSVEKPFDFDPRTLEFKQ